MREGGSYGKRAEPLRSSLTLDHRTPFGATRHLPRTGGVCPLRGAAFCAGFAREKGSSRSGELAEFTRPEGLLPFSLHCVVVSTTSPIDAVRVTLRGAVEFWV